MEYKSGEKPGSGSYQCTKCGYVITVSDDQELPVCPKCGNKKWKKIS